MKKQLLVFISVFLFYYTVFGQITFQKSVIHSINNNSGNETNAMKFGDLDGDGNQDIIIAYGNQITWHRFNDAFQVYESVNIVTDNIFGVTSIFIGDIDNDSDLDILAGSENGNSDRLYWFENTDGNGSFDITHVVGTNLYDAFQVSLADLDTDGDLDILFEESFTNQVKWYENSDGFGNFSSSANNIVSTGSSVFRGLKTADIDGDSNLDIVYITGSYIRWKRNEGNGTFSATQTVSTSSYQYRSFAVSDMDYDGDLDVVAVGVSRVIWFENADGLGDFYGSSNSHLLTNTSSNNREKVEVVDVNNDGYKDILFSTTEYQNNRLVYFEGTNSFGGFDANEVLISDIETQGSFIVTDINNDGDVDICIDKNFSRAVFLYTNSGSLGNFEEGAQINVIINSPKGIKVSDLDNDGDEDLLILSEDSPQLIWLDNIDDNTYIQNDLEINNNIISMSIGDINGDLNTDILYSYDSNIFWLENMNGMYGSPINITNSLSYVTDIKLKDIDDDNDNDIIAVSLLDDKLVVFENLDGLGSFGSEQIISQVNNPKSTSLNDFNGDGFLDILLAADNEIAWFENINGQGNFSQSNIVGSISSFDGEIISKDIDNDGDIDIVALNPNLVWYENIDGLGSFVERPMILNTSNLNNVLIKAGDIDEDQDIDILVTYKLSTNNTWIRWYENTDGLGGFNTFHTLDSNLNDLSSISLKDFESDGDIDLLYSSSVLNEIGWYKNLGVLGNEINGVVQLDLDLDGCTLDDIKIGNLLIGTNNGNDSFSSFTQLDGSYQIALNLGTFETSVISSLNYFNVTPISNVSVFNDLGNTEAIDFCFEPIGVINDLNISVYPSLNDPRPGFNTTYQIVYNNIGTTQLSGNVTFEFDDAKLNFLNASETIVSQTANTLTFNFTDLNPFETRTIDLEFNVFAPPTTNIDDVLVSTATVNPVTGDNTADDNVFTLNQTVIGSYDPNDIRVLEGEEILLADADKYLHYIIRFQNTGTASAINVNVENVLDYKLDWTTMQLESLSHTGRVEIANGSMVKFIFDNINLPDSTSDEPNSHGYIAYKIKPKDNVVVGDIFNSTADIFFDFNPAIVTNTVSTEIVNTLSVEDFEASSFLIFPNPANNILNIEGETVIESVTIYDINGRLLNTITSKSKKAKLDVSNLSQGLYFLEITSGNKKESLKFIKK
ncbi:T9SS type A sorting domain-containing protein [Lacinutrix sp. Bg11-31]|uniref:T9SS type A sorting domain-containing protein n=1 Tax=Lacinutrix sp. Bg11-31 TaxID=2057808 RepID=UPI000C31427B|nr:T9SS type A sorting domain-containing protein [Lacinutrix sp. Bg11-31]AUC81236.1 hypothetical protein CW733_03435 [Lacinutrix sp. Bg11-31]